MSRIPVDSTFSSMFYWHGNGSKWDSMLYMLPLKSVAIQVNWFAPAMFKKITASPQ